MKEWAEENGIKINSSLDLYNFPGTGRGFISKRQILKHQTVLEIPKEILLNVNWIYQNGISCISQAVKTNPNFKVDAFEMVTLWLMYEKQRGCRSELRDYISTLPPSRQCIIPLHYRVKQLKLLPKQFRDKVEDLRDEMQDRFESLKRKWREGTTSWSFSWADFQWAATMVLTRGVKCNGLKLIPDLRIGL